MKAIILSAGASSRFWPLASSFHKSFYRVGDGRTVIEYTVSGLLPKFDEITIVVGPGDEERAKSLFSSESKVKVVVLPSPTGAGNAILKALSDDFEGKFFVTGADKVFADKLFDLLEKEGAVVGLRKTASPQHFGIVSMDQDGYLTGLVEKPTKEGAPSEYKVTGAYLLDSSILALLQKNTEEHYSLELSLDEYFKSNKVKGAKLDDMPDTSLHFPWDLLDLNTKLMENGNINYIDPSAKVSPSALVKPPVYIGSNAKIGDFVLIRNGSFIDADTVIGAHSEVKNALIYKGSTIHRTYVGDSIIDSDSRLAGGVITANKRFDRDEIKSVVKGEKVGTGRKAFGAILGKEASLGTNSTIMPGVKVGNSAKVWPGKVQFEDVPDGETSK